MNKFVKILVDKYNKKFKEELGRQKKFFKKPDVLISLGIAALLLLDKLVKEKKTKKEFRDFISKDKNSKIILDQTSKDLNDDNLNDLVLACTSGQEITIPELSENMSAENFLSFADKNSDIDNKINANKFKNLSNKLVDSGELLLTYSFLLYYVIDMTKDLLTKTEHPSKYRTKYIQKLLRNIYGLIKVQSGGVKESEILFSLKQIDNILIAVTLATTIYVASRIKLQKRSRETLRELTKDTACSDFADPGDVSINKIPFKVNLNCPVITDDELVPHTPIEEKLKALSCEIPQNEEIPIESGIKTDLVTMAVIRNTRTDKLEVQVNIDSYVTQELQIGKIGKTQVFGPTTGYVDQLSPNQIVLRDILDPDEDYLTTQINLLGQKYERLNNVKSFLKYYYVGTLYPSMLATAIVDDVSTYDTNSGIEKQWKDQKDVYKQVDKEYEKQIKKITGKANVEKHAKNETLGEIKNQMDAQADIYYKHLKLIGESAINVSKKTKAKSNEYELFEFYSLDLGAAFNGLENPNDLEITFRDQINEYIRKRIIIDGYNKNKIAKKINDQIKDIEKGISIGDWFQKALEKYLPNKKLDDVKTWLQGLADKNKKLKGDEKTTSVNRVMFLFDLWLNYDQLVKKYTVLKKETTPKKATVEEGNWIFGFTQDLWKQHDALPKEIEEIQSIIDSLSLFQTYSVIEYEGKQARLYTVADLPKCKPSDEDFKPSAQGYGDILYWLKYCAFATLASVTNPATGWSTGWIFPSPILLPVVYIPIKAITTKFGFIVMGISICGIWIFPWVLMANLSANHATPFGDPTAALKREIQALKKSIMDQLTNLKKSVVKKMMDDTKAKIDVKEEQLKSTKKSIQENKDAKPSKYANGVKKKDVVYLKEFGLWNEKRATLQEALVTEKTEKWTLSKKWKIFNEAYKAGKSLKGADKGIEQTEKLINDQFDKLNSMVDKLDSIIAPLPITMKPNSANFGITLKNTKPIIKIADELDDNVNEGPLNKILVKFQLKNSDMMSSKYGSKLSSTILNSKSYKAALSAANIVMIQKDPFPKYEKLTPINVPWIAFLYKDFVTTGAKSYGFPGQLPLPI